VLNGWSDWASASPTWPGRVHGVCADLPAFVLSPSILPFVWLVTNFTSNIIVLQEICTHRPMVTQCAIMSEIAELLLAQVWNSQWVRQPLSTTDGRIVSVVYPGVWTHGFGPDFRDAMLEIDGRLYTGDVEVELDVAGWFQHGHDQNENFDNVILQVVSRDADMDAVRRSDGRIVPRLVLSDFLRGPLESFAAETEARPLGQIGFETCAPAVAQCQPDLIRSVWQQAGDRRMQEKVATISGEMAVSSPEQVLYARLLDALGFSRNRDPMQEVAARLPVEKLARVLESQQSYPPERYWTVASLLLGVGGFLPLSPRDAAIARLESSQVPRIESIWSGVGKPWHTISVSPGFWNLARIRPAAHPVRRLLAMAGIFASAERGLVEQLVSTFSTSRPRTALTRWLVDNNPYLGRDHAHEIVVNVLIPFAMAYGGEADQPEVLDRAAGVWAELPAGRGNAVVRQTQEQICGDEDVQIGSARAEQGLIHIHRSGCRQMRCFECPIAHLTLQFQRETASETVQH
jgi:hypothetical protein